MKAKTNARPVTQHQKDVALLVIDVQQGLFARSTPIYHADDLLKNIGTLVDRAHRAGAPAFYVQHSSEKILVEGSDEWQLHPQRATFTSTWEQRLARCACTRRSCARFDGCS